MKPKRAQKMVAPSQDAGASLKLQVEKLEQRGAKSSKKPSPSKFKLSLKDTHLRHQDHRIKTEFGFRMSLPVSKIFVASQESYTCAGCNQQIRDRYLLNACNKFWHDNCLKCDRCQAKLGELGPTLYEKNNMNLCRQDYFEMFGQKAICSVCDKLIYASEMVMRAKQNVYHLECFACQLCGLRFCIGDRFHLFENKIVCQYDYDEHLMPIQESMQLNQQQQLLQQLPTGTMGMANNLVSTIEGDRNEISANNPYGHVEQSSSDQSDAVTGPVELDTRFETTNGEVEPRDGAQRGIIGKPTDVKSPGLSLGAAENEAGLQRGIELHECRSELDKSKRQGAIDSDDDVSRARPQTDQLKSVAMDKD